MITRWQRQWGLAGLLLLMTMIFYSCASQQDELKADNIAETFQKGMSYLEKENYLKAEEVFTFIIYNDPAGPYADDAQYYLGETYYAREDYLLAIAEYDRLIRRMKNSPFVEDAFWKKTEAYCELSPDYRLKRDMTDKALKYLSDFLEIYPNSKHRPEVEARIVEMREKLARKYLESAQLYDTLHEYESAIFYYDAVLEEYGDTRLAVVARLGKAGDMVALERWDEARQLLNAIAISGYQDLSKKEVSRMKALGKQVLSKTGNNKN